MKKKLLVRKNHLLMATLMTATMVLTACGKESATPTPEAASSVSTPTNAANAPAAGSTTTGPDAMETPESSAPGSMNSSQGMTTDASMLNTAPNAASSETDHDHMSDEPHPESTAENASTAVTDAVKAAQEAGAKMNQ